MSQRRCERPKNFGAFRDALSQHFDSLSPHLKRIARYALGEPNRVALKTVAQVATETGVQPSTLVRFAKTFGFTGYADMQQLFRLRLTESENAFRDRTLQYRNRVRDVARGDSTAILDTFADASVLAIEQLKARIDADTLREAVRAMRVAHCIHVIGRGSAWPVTACLAYGLFNLRLRCVVMDAQVGLMSEQVEAMSPEDLLIAAELEGDSQPLIDAVASAQARQFPVLAFTDDPLSQLARHSSLCFVIQDAAIYGAVPLAPHVALAQSLIVALAHVIKCEDNTKAEN